MSIMTKKPIDSTQNVILSEIPNNTLTDIARIVRACAEIESITDAYICKMTNLGEAIITTLIGPVALSRKVDIGIQLATLINNRTGANFKINMNDDFKKLMQLRNAIAHGSFLGSDNAGNLLFQTNKVAGAEEGGVAVMVRAYHPEFISLSASYAEKLGPKLIDDLELQKWQQKRANSTLLNSPKNFGSAKNQPSKQA